MQRRLVFLGAIVTAVVQITNEMKRRLVMIDKTANVTASSSAEVPRVGGEDKSRVHDSNSRAGGLDDTREIVDDLSHKLPEKS